MGWFTQLIGLGLVILALIDVFLSVLYPRSGKGWLSVPLSRGIWKLFGFMADLPRWKRQKTRDRILSYAGPTVLVIVIAVWVLLLLFGFALMVWVALGSAIQSSNGPTPTDFITAFYYSGYTLTTSGFGDLVPQTNSYRLLAIIESALGFSIFTLTITYLLSVYSALTQRNVFALSLHHQTARAANAAELLARLGADGDFQNSRQDIAQIAVNALMLLESHHAYPVLHYFRFQRPYYAMARIALLTMDTATLIRSALDEKQYRSLVNSTAVAALGDGGQHLLTELSNSFLPNCDRTRQQQPDSVLRQWYYQAIDRLQLEGIATPADLDAGAELYITLRRQWEPYVMAMAAQLKYDWSDIAPAEQHFQPLKYPDRLGSV
ncbi:two pore domain potassium channel family protein [Oscillatoria sp. FACHB-1407]|nr:two pore domain potassium channel family protein [Oscillatoria sp. FACHB-1407]